MHGIEWYWRLAKYDYRKMVRAKLVRGELWNQEKIIKKIFYGIREHKVIDCAAVGLRNLLRAQPVDPRTIQEQYEDKPELKVHQEILGRICPILKVMELN